MRFNIFHDVVRTGPKCSKSANEALHTGELYEHTFFTLNGLFGFNEPP
jgi:hypothetical protein